jgi:hypothetical protein
MQEDEEIVLTVSECEALHHILDQFLLYQTYNKSGVRYCMRNKIIWINQKNYVEKSKHKGTKGLLRKKIIQPHPILGYQVRIKSEYLEQIYDLLDNQDRGLVVQLANIWVER